MKIFPLVLATVFVVAVNATTTDEHPQLRGGTDGDINRDTNSDMKEFRRFLKPKGKGDKAKKEDKGGKKKQDKGGTSTSSIFSGGKTCQSIPSGTQCLPEETCKKEKKGLNLSKAGYGGCGSGTICCGFKS